VDFIKHLDKVGYLSCIVSIFEIRVDFCSHFHLLWFTPCHRVIFLVTELATILGKESSFRGLECFSPSFILSFLSSDYLKTSFHFESEFLGLILNLAVFPYIYTVFSLAFMYIRKLSFCRKRIYTGFS
jgi:hypothetical protein